MGSVKESQKAGVEHVVRLLRDTFEFGMLCTVTRDGQLRSRPMTIGRVDDDGDVWFATSIDSPKVPQSRFKIGTDVFSLFRLPRFSANRTCASRLRSRTSA